MATLANAATAKGAMSTDSSKSILRATAPQLRTAVALIQKHEQIQDALEHGSITGKVAEQMNQTLKGIVGIEKLGLQYLSLALKYGKHAAPVPRSPILRNMLGLREELAPTDVEVVRKLLP
jgi:hypothetical protein